MKIYMDVCCLNRPFDNLNNRKIRLENEAILTILERCEKGEWTLVLSEVTYFEILKTPDIDRRNKVLILASIAKKNIKINDKIEKRAKQIEKLKFSSFDALHIACAEFSGADIMLTTDKKILKKYTKLKEKLEIRIENPLKWITEIL